MKKKNKHRLSIFLIVLLVVAVSGCVIAQQAKQMKKTARKAENTTETPQITIADNMEKGSSSEQTEIAEKVTTEAEVTESTTEEIASEESLDDLKQKLLDDISGSGFDLATVSVFVKDLQEQDYVNLDAGAGRAASLIKLFVAGTVYEEMKNGTLSSSYEGELPSLVSNMITVSDNTACNTLVKKLGDGSAAKGMDKVNAYCAEHGFTATSMGRLMLNFSSSKDNITSVTDCTRFLRLVYENKITGAKEILSYLKQQTRTGKIPAGVPSFVTTANKTGELDDTENDAAIIYLEGKPYILCVMVTQTTNVAAARKLITTISKHTYEYLSEES